MSGMALSLEAKRWALWALNTAAADAAAYNPDRLPPLQEAIEYVKEADER